jgi:hypothetical protein
MMIIESRFHSNVIDLDRSGQFPGFALGERGCHMIGNASKGNKQSKCAVAIENAAKVDNEFSFSRFCIAVKS